MGRARASMEIGTAGVVPYVHAVSYQQAFRGFLSSEKRQLGFWHQPHVERLLLTVETQSGDVMTLPGFE